MKSHRTRQCLVAVGCRSPRGHWAPRDTLHVGRLCRGSDGQPSGPTCRSAREPDVAVTVERGLPSREGSRASLGPGTEAVTAMLGARPWVWRGGPALLVPARQGRPPSAGSWARLQEERRALRVRGSVPFVRSQLLISLLYGWPASAHFVRFITAKAAASCFRFERKLGTPQWSVFLRFEKCSYFTETLKTTEKEPHKYHLRLPHPDAAPANTLTCIPRGFYDYCFCLCI